ncbi:MAG: DUF1559 domain-containing protein [Thermoguttaceae bacterium]
MKRPLYGFTLVELLVVIAIIGMLVGLLLPAVNMAREAGRRSVCENNLHQLSTACSSHVGKLGFYPSGGWGSNWVGIPDYGTGLYQPGGWIYQLLPYMDQDSLHELGKGGSLAVSSSASAVRVATPIPILYCPTRRAGQAYPILPGNTGGTKAPQAGRTDYAINGGSVLPSNLPANPHFAGPPATTTVSTAASYFQANGIPSTTFNGIASIYSQVTEAMIPDNKETTYLMGEKYMSPENYFMGNDPGDLFSAMSGDDVSLIRWGNDNLNLLPSMDRTAKNSPPPQQIAPLIFGSSHGAGWHAAFCDGHVQMIAWGFWPPDPTANCTLHQAMATRNGHEVVDPSKIPK